MFKLSKKAEYCLLALRRMAEQRDEVVTVRDLAAHCRIPQPLLAKLMQAMARHRLLDSAQGVRGGYRLNRDLSQISLAQVVESVEGPLRLTACREEEGRCRRHSFCDLKTRMAPLQSRMRQYLDDVKLTDL